MEQKQQIINALTVDVEDYYQVEAFSTVVRRDQWSQWESRVERNTRTLLALFARHNVCATFFTLGWVAERHPALIRDIVRAGHEIACHGYEHRLIYRQTPDEFRRDVQRARGILEDLTGQPVYGYRAPSYSITARSLWALDILIEEGFQYDSSIFPIHHDRYGMPEAERFPHVLTRNEGSIIEFPPSTVRLFGLNLPVSGGGYFRLFPFALFRQGLHRINQREAQPAIFFVHPWEVDPQQPRVPASHLSNWRHRVNLHRTLPRLERLLERFHFAPVRQVLSGLLPLERRRLADELTKIRQPQPAIR